MAEIGALGASAAGGLSGTGGVMEGAAQRQSDVPPSGGAQAPSFAEVWQGIQAKYGEKPEKPREIKKTLDKDDFLKIMMTQMKNQDPTNPFKAEQFASELAQFTSLEQLKNVNQNLTKMTTQNQPLERMAMTGLIGKQVTVDRQRFSHTENMKTNLSFTLPVDAEETKVTILNEAGETVSEQEIGPSPKGQNVITWDGLKSNTLPAASGNYVLRVEGKDAGGKPIQVASKIQSRIIGISFEGAEPVFLVGNHQRQEKVPMRSIAQIEDGAALGLPQIPGAESLAEKTEQARVVGGSTPGAQAQARAQIQPNDGGEGPGPVAQAVQQALAAHRGAAETQEKGFPNGLGQ